MLTPGMTLGPYRVVAPIGAGGMGEVYRATDTRLSRDVAIKVLPAKVAGDSDRLRRFEQEARAAGMLNHPNILSIFDVGQHDSSPYVVSELLEGETLRERMSGGGRLPVKRAIDYASQIASGLAAAHEKGIVHRDLKPENLFITTDGRVKILDFGLARILAVVPDSNASQIETTPGLPGTDPGTVLGTVGYMSPEQVRGGAADARSDIFSFGTVLYEMLSGTQAFRRSSAVETMNAILKEEPPELDTAIEGVPPELARIVHHCLEKQPSARFQSAHDISFSLESMSGVRSGNTTGRVAVQPSRRIPRWLLPVAAVLIAALLCGATYLATMRYASHPLPQYRRLTYGSGGVFQARFTPDGQSAIYDAGQSPSSKSYAVNFATSESRPTSLSGRLLAISSKGEAAVQLHPTFIRAFTYSGTLATEPVDATSAPREVLEDVIYADYAPGTNELAILHIVNGRDQLEYPRGKVLYRTEHALAFPRFSPDGRSIAFTEVTHPNSDIGFVAMVGLDGRYKALTGEFYSLRGLAWSAKGDEVWFSGGRTGSMRQLYAVTPGGDERQIASMPLAMILQDVHRDGRVLFAFNQDERLSMKLVAPGDTRERDLSWFDWSLPKDISADGKQVLFDETGDAAGSIRGIVFIRDIDGSPAVRLRDDATATSIAPDNASVLTIAAPSGQVQQVPIHAGEAKILTHDALRHSWARFLPDMKHFAFVATEKGHGARLYVADANGANAHAISPEGIGPGPAMSPDGQWIAATGMHSHLMLFPTAGGEARPVPNVRPNEACVGWMSDNHTLFVAERATADVDTVDLITGRRAKWKSVAEGSVIALRLGTDGREAVFGRLNTLSTLFLADGLR